ncbi:methyl-accepting chemotaxis protein [Natrarchaeobius oligotrophus]|uniref:HAMP domain-containing protein n=1 Tax=Natrarchaeobius chitinivorans TaxID=1679083 RepID=A0A3N6NQ61_NATCH|nr:methyl-accepting chemotaxis protein [Natrarchaeobius chitinivorans]RQH01933.1 HAMP domain-containing protein [Natrarchaeobius chitinivorans]
MSIVRRLVPAAIRRRYTVKLAIVLLLLGLSVGAVGFVATAGITDEVEQRAEATQLSLAERDAQGLQTWHERNERTVETLAWSGALEGDDPAAIEDRLLEWQSGVGDEAVAVSYLDTANGTVLASTDESLRDRSIDDVDGVDPDALGDDESQISSPYLFDGADGERVVVTYVRSTGDDRALAYAVDLESEGAQLEASDRGVTVVVDGANEIVLDDAGYGDGYETLGLEYDDGSADLARSEGATTRQAAAGSASVLESYGVGDEAYVVAAAPVDGTDWVVLVHETERSAYGIAAIVDEWGYVASGIAALLIGLFGVVLGRNTASSVDRIAETTADVEAGTLEATFESKRLDSIGRLSEGVASMRDSLVDRIEEAEAARDEAERERDRIQRRADRLERTARAYGDVIATAADGDLTARMDDDSEDEAMADLAAAFNEMIADLERAVAKLDRFAANVSTTAEQVTSSSQEVRSASERVTESIQAISAGADRQHESLQSVDREMNGLSTATEEIAAASSDVVDIAERTVETGRSGREAARNAVDAMDEIEREAEDAVAEIQRLEREVQQIDELIAAISDIARQTNMLALNANIEASRSVSSEEEEGFSVVAQEVKALSEDVARAANEAEDRLEAIRERTERSAAEVEGTSVDIEDAGEEVQAAVDALEEIADLAQETSAGVKEISGATEEQAASTQAVVATVDDAATVSEETSAAAGTVADAAQEQTSALTEVTQSATQLTAHSSRLASTLDRFETDVDRADLEDADPADDLEAGDEPESDGSTDVLEFEDAPESVDLEDEPIDAATGLESGNEAERPDPSPADGLGDDPLEDDPLEDDPLEAGSTNEADPIDGIGGDLLDDALEEPVEDESGGADPVADVLEEGITFGTSESALEASDDPLEPADESDDGVDADGEDPLEPAADERTETREETADSTASTEADFAPEESSDPLAPSDADEDDGVDPEEPDRADEPEGELRDDDPLGTDPLGDDSLALSDGESSPSIPEDEVPDGDGSLDDPEIGADESGTDGSDPIVLNESRALESSESDPLAPADPLESDESERLVPDETDPLAPEETNPAVAENDEPSEADPLESAEIGPSENGESDPLEPTEADPLEELEVGSSDRTESGDEPVPLQPVESGDDGNDEPEEIDDEPEGMDEPKETSDEPNGKSADDVFTFGGPLEEE